MQVGRISKLFGSAGQLSVVFYDTLPDNFQFEEYPLFANVDNLDVPLFCEEVVRKGVQGAVVRFADIDTVTRAEMLVGKELYIEAEEDDDEFTFEDLIGFEVRVSRRKGRLTDFYDSDVNPLFEIEISGKTHLVPAHEEFIAGIDFERGKIKMVLPDGLLEL